MHEAMDKPKSDGSNLDYFYRYIHQEESVDPIEAPYEKRKPHIIESKYIANP